MTTAFMSKKTMLKKVKKPSVLEETLFLHFKAFDVPPPRREFLFHHTRKWRFDFAWPDIKFAVEVEGITRNDGGGRHQRAKGFEDDLDKYHAAQLAQWQVYRCSGRLIRSLEAVKLIVVVIEHKRRQLGIYD